MKVIIGADHNGFEHKKYLISKLGEAGYTVIDVGPSALDPEDDYPDFVIPMAQKVAEGAGVGVFICASGLGPCMVANKVAGIRAGTARVEKEAIGLRAHQDANVLGIGADYTTPEEALHLIDTFLKTPFEGDRHQRRVDKMMKLER